jgi:hypothetical protein
MGSPHRRGPHLFCRPRWCAEVSCLSANGWPSVVEGRAAVGRKDVSPPAAVPWCSRPVRMQVIVSRYRATADAWFESGPVPAALIAATS